MTAMLRWRMILSAVAVTVGVVGAVAIARSSDTPRVEGAQDVGPNPFMEGGAAPVPVRPTTLRAITRAADDEVGADDARARRRLAAVITTARQRGVPVAPPASPAGAAIYGGSGENACDTAELVRFLEAHPEEAAAWAAVHGITPQEVPAYVATLTPGWLVADTHVRNHGFVDGRAIPRFAVLEAGTAVLVDDQGIPRVRCMCGNPLREALVELDGELVHAQAFADATGESATGPGVEQAHSHPRQALGPPDCDNQTFCWNDAFVSIGTATGRCQFSVTLRFVDNVMFNGRGDDLRIVEIGHLEPTDVFVEHDGGWEHVGRIEGGDETIDLPPSIDADAEITHVRLCDAPDRESSSSPGADIDAVAALNWRPA